jgi:SAM-dependent methyltransferase
VGSPEKTDIDVVLPVYRSRDSLRELHARLRRTLVSMNASGQLIFVNDACPQGSLDVLSELAHADAQVRVVDLVRNVGQHRAVLAGLRQSHAPRVVIMDADLQDAPEAIPLLAARLNDGTAAVFAGRRGRYESIPRLCTSWLFKRLLHLACGVPKDAGMFAILDRRMIERLLAMEVSRPFVVAMIGCAGLPTVSVPVARDRRPRGRTSYGSLRRLGIGLGALTWALRRRLTAGRDSPQLSPTDLVEHNRLQSAYYAGPLKRNMVPRDSLYLRRHVDELMRFGLVSPGQKVLEIGCGMGRYTLILAARGVDVEGMDLSPELLAHFRSFQNGRFQVPLHLGDVLDLPPALHGRFDAVIGFFVLHHLHDVPRCLESLRRALRPGGRMAFVEPNPYNGLYYIQMMLKPRMTWQGDKGMLDMRRAPLFRAMERAGLGDLAMMRFGFFPPFLADRRWGARLESIIERAPVWKVCLPFQVFRGTLRSAAERS